MEQVSGKVTKSNKGYFLIKFLVFWSHDITTSVLYLFVYKFLQFIVKYWPVDCLLGTMQTLSKSKVSKM